MQMQLMNDGSCTYPVGSGTADTGYWSTAGDAYYVAGCYSMSVFKW